MEVTSVRKSDVQRKDWACDRFLDSCRQPRRVRTVGASIPYRHYSRLYRRSTRGCHAGSARGVGVYTYGYADPPHGYVHTQSADTYSGPAYTYVDTHPTHGHADLAYTHADAHPADAQADNRPVYAHSRTISYRDGDHYIGTPTRPECRLGRGRRKDFLLGGLHRLPHCQRRRRQCGT